MEKRLLVAIALSFLVLGAYTSILPKKQNVENKEVVVDVQRKALTDVGLQPGAGLDKTIGINNRNILNDNDLYEYDSPALLLKFSKIGGYLYEVYDKVHQSSIVVKNIGLIKGQEQNNFVANEILNGVSLTYEDNTGLVINKIYRIKSDNVIQLTIEINGANDSSKTRYDIEVGSVDSARERDQVSARYYESCALVNGITVRKSAYGQKKPIDYNGHVNWAGLRDRYFCAVVFPQFTVNNGVVENNVGGSSVVLNIAPRPIDANSNKIEDIYDIYIGIQDETALKNFGGGAEKLINFGTFDGISKVLLFFLKLAYKVSKNWGIAIILITIFIYLLLFPLSFKSMLSMKKMQSLQPKIEELRAKFKDNPQKLNTEIMDLYRREKANPFGGCLPMLLQIPVFFALYQLLMRFIGLRGAGFLWIADLAQPDRAYVFQKSYPIFGNELNILPLLMAVGMFFQQKITSQQSAASPEAMQQQKIMMIVMPVIFGAMFYKLPAGLVLYWFVNSLLMLGFQWKISKIKV